MKRNLFAATTLGMLLVLVTFVTEAQNRRYDAQGNNDYAYGRGGNPNNYPFDDRNPYDTRNRSFDNYNPYDPRPSYDKHGHGRCNDDDYRCACEAKVYCGHRQRWASSHYPLDPRNPYDVRNQRPNGNGDGRKVVVVRPAIVLNFPTRRHPQGW